MSEVENVVGVLEQVIDSGKKGGSSMRVNGMKIGVWDNKAIAGLREGDTVSFRWEKGAHIKDDIYYKNLKGLVTKVNGGVTPVPQAETKREAFVPDSERQRSIIRQNSLTNAVNHMQNPLASADEVIELARKFEAYSSGDLDREAKERLTNSVEEKE